MKINKIHLNPPILKTNRNKYFNSTEDFYTYLIENPDHKIRINSYQPNNFMTKHYYEDGLLINSIWKLKNGLHAKETFKEYDKISMHVLKNLIDKDLIELLYAEIWEYSKERNEEDYDGNLKGENLRQVLEYEVKEPSTISDEEFDLLAKQINNFIKFEKYLEENNINI